MASDGIELEVGFWIRDPEEGTLAVRSDISREILRRFTQEGVEIPYPQREIRWRGTAPSGAVPRAAGEAG
jgi:small-conductance mechanosensitive channel